MRTISQWTDKILSTCSKVPPSITRFAWCYVIPALCVIALWSVAHRYLEEKSARLEAGIASVEKKNADAVRESEERLRTETEDVYTDIARMKKASAENVRASKERFRKEVEEAARKENERAAAQKQRWLKEYHSREARLRQNQLRSDRSHLEDAAALAVTTGVIQSVSLAVPGCKLAKDYIVATYWADALTPPWRKVVRLCEPQRVCARGHCHIMPVLTPGGLLQCRVCGKITHSD